MPLQWHRDRKSPYACNHFAVLQVGPNTRRPEITEQVAEKNKELKANKKVCCACGHEVDEHELGSAKNRLLEPRSYAEELLLVHPQPPKDDRKRIKALVENLCMQAQLPLLRQAIPLREPAAIFWFTPAPAAEVIPLPAWADLGLPHPGSPDDLAHDIVFDS